MSKWEDTVMSAEQIVAAVKSTGRWVDIDYSPFEEDRRIAKVQAEISFKMGYNQALKDIRDGFSPLDMV